MILISVAGEEGRGGQQRQPGQQQDQGGDRNISNIIRGDRKVFMFFFSYSCTTKPVHKAVRNICNCWRKLWGWWRRSSWRTGRLCHGSSWERSRGDAGLNFFFSAKRFLSLWSPMQGSEGMFIPECDREGRYLPVQCYKSEGYCWWVCSAHCAAVVDLIILYFVFCDMDC